MSTLMLSELNALPSIGTISSLVEAVVNTLTGRNSRELVIGYRVLVEITTCRTCLSRHLNTRKIDECVHELEDQWRVLTQHFLEKEVPFSEACEATDMLHVDAILNKALAIFMNKTDYRAPCDDNGDSCDYHTRLSGLSNAALTLAMLEFQKTVMTQHLLGDSNRSDPESRVASATAEIIRTWKWFPHLREAVEAIQPLIVVEGEEGNPLPSFLRQAE